MMAMDGEFYGAYAYDDGTGDAPGPGPAPAGGNNTTTSPEPQQTLNEFWTGLIAKQPGKVFQIFPKSLYQHLLPPIKPTGAASHKDANESYEAAAAECRERVKRIVRECHRTNEKFTDPDFDIESDFQSGQRNCLKSLSTNVGATTADVVVAQSSGVGSGELKYALSTLVNSRVLTQDTMSVDVMALNDALNDQGDFGSDGGDDFSPQSIHRVDYIFEEPLFVKDGYSTTDVHQGQTGDCWWVAAVATLCSLPHLMDKICVERDVECGVYGFVFFRDGEWISTVVDDNLYVT
jgi:Calpain family cysteine protease